MATAWNVGDRVAVVGAEWSKGTVKKVDPRGAWVRVHFDGWPESTLDEYAPHELVATTPPRPLGPNPAGIVSKDKRSVRA